MQNYELKQYFSRNNYKISRYDHTETSDVLVRVETENGDPVPGYEVLKFKNHDEYIEWLESITGGWLYKIELGFLDLLAALATKDSI